MTAALWYRVLVGGEAFKLLVRLRVVDGSVDPLSLEVIRAEQLHDGHFVEVDIPKGAAEAVKEEMLRLA